MEISRRKWSKTRALGGSRDGRERRNKPPVVPLQIHGKSMQSGDFSLTRAIARCDQASLGLQHRGSAGEGRRAVTLHYSSPPPSESADRRTTRGPAATSLSSHRTFPPTRVELRSDRAVLSESLRAWVHDRLGRELGKYAPQIERVHVRFEDLNGPKGGIDKCCMVHLVLAKLSSVVVEMRGQTEREAFDLAVGRAERAARRSIEKHRLGTKLSK
jgi:putative sigma-54 modulation protein